MKPLVLALSLGLVCASGMAHAAPSDPHLAPTVGVSVQGDVAKPGTWTLAKIQKLAPAQTIITKLKGEPYTAKGIPLRVLLEAAAPKFPTQTKHPEGRFIVLASGKDGYTVSFSWPDLMEEVGNQQAFVIWEANGKPLGEDPGPIRLIVPGDKKPMRWVYRLSSLRVYDGARYHK